MASRIGSLLTSTRLRSLKPIYSLRPFSTTSSSSPPTSRFTNNPSSFDWSDSEPESESDSQSPPIDKSKLPPPYDPFSNKPAVPEPSDPTNLQEVFFNMRTEGLTNYAIKMFDGLSKDGRTHEALELFSVIKDKQTMPDVVAHTAVIEAYVNAGGDHWKSAIRTYEKMLACGVLPNAYTFSVLIKGLVKESKLTEAGKYLIEMVTRGMKPNVTTFLSVFEGYVSEEKFEEGKKLLQELKEKGFEPDEKFVRDDTVKRGYIFNGVMRLLFDK
ncbi:Ribosomal protein L15 [Rhynchospora pubera]|uniref:Ribosomal protein L15 n=1 Tax=Rhynchospora pubera TaxID=906938 RepID=A0AAV8GX11_9POAL|nr:Ribosomal protein L15 [Rhynchospora pubera]KAJ4807002.1 Ribosomal protein L15 [Rhynchospora pubera]